MAHSTPPVRDAVDVMVEQWRRQQPELDVVSKAVSIRLRRVAHHLEREVRRELARLDVELWELDMLLALHNAEGRRLGAGDLLRASQVTSGAITNRLARLEQRGWVRRDVDPSDRRQVLVTLTDAGWDKAAELAVTKTESERRFFAPMDAEMLGRLAADLRTLLVAIEGPAPDPAGAD
jgi:DNA-binding MarR family transcriptional regulator